MSEKQYKSRLATVGWVCGAISIILVFNMPILSFLLGVTAVSIGIKEYKVAQKPANIAITTGVIGAFLVLLVWGTTTAYDSIQQRAKEVGQTKESM